MDVEELETQMSPRARLVAALLIALSSIVLKPVASRAGTEVDLALVLAVDISGSMDPEEQQLQRQGFVLAFRSPVVHQAIRDGMLGRIVVVYAEWAGDFIQRVVVPWTVIEAEQDAIAFANRLEASPIQRGPRTSISGAIDLGVKLLDDSTTEPVRKVIDISGDGVNNQGRSVTLARDEAVARGITINGLPLLLKRQSGSWDIENLDAYFRECVIGGPGAFMIPVRERQQFADAIKTKIIREIAGTTEKAVIIPTQAVSGINCSMTGTPYWER
jgi:Protein of unknown function (DUF1194)